MEKKEIRKIIIEKRNNISKNEKDIKDENIAKTFINLELYKKAKNLCIYVNYGSEINTQEIIKLALKDGKEIFVPKMRKERKLDFLKINSLEDLEKNKMGILEPKEHLKEKVDQIDILILPGLGFDFNGGRIGYGGGYYDRYLLGKNVLKVALSYDIQILDYIPMESHDIRYDYLITESKILKLK